MILSGRKKPNNKEKTPTSVGVFILIKERMIANFRKKLSVFAYPAVRNNAWVNKIKNFIINRIAL